MNSLPSTSRAIAEATAGEPPSPTAETVSAPASFGRTLLVLSGAAALSLALTGWIGARQPQAVGGRLAAPTISVVAPEGGRLTQLNVDDGSRVRPGDVLGLVVDDSLASRLATAAERVAALETELARREARADVELAWRLKEIDEEILDTELRTAELMRHRFDVEVDGLALSEIARVGDDALPFHEPVGDAWRPLVHRELVPEGTRLQAAVEAQRARNAAEVYAAQLELFEKRLAELRRTRETLGDGVRRAEGVDSVAAELKQTRAAVERLRSQPAETPIEATAHGRVVSVPAEVESIVAEGDVLLSLSDVARPFVELHVPSERVAEFPVDRSVRVIFPNGVERTGRIVATSDRVVVRRGREHDPAAETFVRTRVEPTGKLWPEPPLGTRVEVRPEL